MRCLLLLLLLLAMLPLQAGGKKPWYERRRQETPSLHYPHELHKPALEEAGLGCLSCHAFSALDEKSPASARRLALIANEPLKSICHACHVVDRSAPARCTLCHAEPERIWPEDHNFQYLKLHGPDARRDESACRECHLGLDECVQCHFRRGSGSEQHAPGYRYGHGIEARLAPADCGRCHNPSYCTDCHVRMWR